jgi:hypothetical protein
MEVSSGASLGNFSTTFQLGSLVTYDSNISNNKAVVPFTVVSVAELKISLNFLHQKAMYGHIKPQSPLLRANVGREVIMEVTVSNVHTANLSKAVLSIFYPASSTETGDYFYILPHCELTTAITVNRVNYYLGFVLIISRKSQPSGSNASIQCLGSSTIFSVSIEGGGSIICQDSQLQDISTLSCSNSRRKRIVQLLLSTA